MAKKQVVVIGLGRFGTSLVRTLTDLGHEVLGLDINMRKVEDVSEFATQTAQIDATDEDALRQMGVRNFDIAVVAIGSDVKSSILTTLLLKRLGVKMVISKAQDELHGDILGRVGADKVVFPERETGIRLAHSITTPNLVDYLEVLPGFGIAKLVAPPAFVGRELGEIDLKGRFGVTVLILRRGDDLILNPSRSELVGSGDELIIAGRDEQMETIRTS
ncbi:MAG: potassium channel family protein [Chloroflexota bacterium]|jgi:trk system potassium uptake protein TrkA